MGTRTERLRQLLAEPGLIVLPGCHDAISARIMERAGFPLAFMSGLAVSAARLGDGDTGYGNAITAEEERYRTAVDGARSAP